MSEAHMVPPASRTVPIASNQPPLGKVVGPSFELLKRHFGTILLLAAISYLPSGLLIFVLSSPSPFEVTSASTVSVLIALLVTVPCSLVAHAAVTYAAIQGTHGQSFTMGEALSAALERLLPLIGVTICVVAVVLLGMLLLVVPGVILLCMYYVSWVICLVERRGVFDSISRSASLTKGYRWHVFGIIVLVMLMNLAVGNADNLKISLAVVLGIDVPGSASPPNFSFNAIVFIADLIINTVTTAVLSVLSAVLYLRLQSAKDGTSGDVRV